MKKNTLTCLALLGITAALGVIGCQNQTQTHSNNKGAADEQITPDMQAFFNSLTPEAQKQFTQLDAEHKMMAIEMMQSSCAGKNSCKGLGGCATASHSCAGKNGCKGEGGAPLKNPSDAVSVQFTNQMGEREKATDGMKGS